MELTQAKSYSPMLILSPVSELTHIQPKLIYTAENEPELPFLDDLPKKEAKYIAFIVRGLWGQCISKALRCSENWKCESTRKVSPRMPVLY